MNETTLKNSIKKYISEIGGFSLKLSDRFTSGIPDMWIGYKGRSIWVELKAVDGRLSKLQEWTISKIKAAGNEAYVVRSLKELKEIIGLKEEKLTEKLKAVFYE